MEEDLVNQMQPKKRLEVKVVTNINKRKERRKERKKEQQRQMKKKQSLRDKFRLRLEHGKLIEENPSAFTENSDMTINQNNTLNQFNPHNPQNFKKSKQSQLSEITEKRPLSEVEMFERQEMMLEKELNGLNQYRPQINKVEGFVGVRKNYRHTRDFLNKNNPDYEVEDTLGYYDENQIEESLKNLDNLILRKRYNQGIPFEGVPNYPEEDNYDDFQEEEFVNLEFKNGKQEPNHNKFNKFNTNFEQDDDVVMYDNHNTHRPPENMPLPHQTLQTATFKDLNTVINKNEISTVETTYSSYATQNQQNRGGNHEFGGQKMEPVQEESAENYQSTPQISNKQPEAGEVSGYLALIKKKKKIYKEKVGSEKMPALGQNRQETLRTESNVDKDEKVVKTDAGNLMINTGVDLKKLFL